MEIDGVELLTDSEGRYNLNSLAKAAKAQGVTKDIRPGEFLSTVQAREMISELIKGDSAIKPVNAKRGRAGGTFVVQELVTLYAAWVSPAFNLKVHRVFLNQQQPAVALPDNVLQIPDINGKTLAQLGPLFANLALACEQSNLKVERLTVAKVRADTLAAKAVADRSKLVEDIKPIVKVVDTLTNTDGSDAVRDCAAVLKVRPTDLSYELVHTDRNWCYRRSTPEGETIDKLRVRGPITEKGFMVTIEQPRLNSKGETVYEKQARITKLGMAELAKVPRILKPKTGKKKRAPLFVVPDFKDELF